MSEGNHNTPHPISLLSPWQVSPTGVLQDIDKHAPTLRGYFRNFIRFFWYFQSIFPIKFPLFSQKHCLINQIQTYSLRHEPAMRLPHACYVIHARDGWYDCKHHFRSTYAPAPPSQFQNALDQSACRMSPSCSAKTSRAHHLHDNGPFHHITDASLRKYYHIWINSFTIG